MNQWKLKFFLCISFLLYICFSKKKVMGPLITRKDWKEVLGHLEGSCILKEYLAWMLQKHISGPCRICLRFSSSQWYELTEVTQQSWGFVIQNCIHQDCELWLLFLLKVLSQCICNTDGKRQINQISMCHQVCDYGLTLFLKSNCPAWLQVLLHFFL